MPDMSKTNAAPETTPTSYFCEHTDRDGNACIAEAAQTRRYSAAITWNLCHKHALEHDTETSKGRSPRYALAV